eukprot:gb/GEZN01006767.1/.p1 GENE.gb/GEZN01006767.1/~~gb/GEZN01006767.1/.p1  ORF type:complete len:534 (-),score=58.59 gb/GEZN01006767.1/:18-1580(-)
MSFALASLAVLARLHGVYMRLSQSISSSLSDLVRASEAAQYIALPAQQSMQAEPRLLRPRKRRKVDARLLASSPELAKDSKTELLIDAPTSIVLTRLTQEDDPVSSISANVAVDADLDASSVVFPVSECIFPLSRAVVAFRAAENVMESHGLQNQEMSEVDRRQSNSPATVVVRTAQEVPLVTEKAFEADQRQEVAATCKIGSDADIFEESSSLAPSSVLSSVPSTAYQRTFYPAVTGTSEQHVTQRAKGTEAIVQADLNNQTRADTTLTDSTEIMRKSNVLDGFQVEPSCHQAPCASKFSNSVSIALTEAQQSSPSCLPSQSCSILTSDVGYEQDTNSVEVITSLLTEPDCSERVTGSESCSPRDKGLREEVSVSSPLVASDSEGSVVVSQPDRSLFTTDSPCLEDLIPQPTFWLPEHTQEVRVLDFISKPRHRPPASTSSKSTRSAPQPLLPDAEGRNYRQQRLFSARCQVINSSSASSSSILTLGFPFFRTVGRAGILYQPFNFGATQRRLAMSARI